MDRLPEPCQLVVVDGLLSMFAKRMCGALDLGLVLLLESPADKYPQFIARHVAAPMRALLPVLNMAAAEAVTDLAVAPFETLVLDTEDFLSSLDELGRPDPRTADAAAGAARRLGEAVRRINDRLVEIGQGLCFKPSVLRDFGPERQASIGCVIDGLPAALAAERPAGTRPAP